MTETVPSGKPASGRIKHLWRRYLNGLRDDIAYIRRKLGLGAPSPKPTGSAASSVKSALAAQKRYLVSAGLFTGTINILALSGSLFMLQVYDRVLPSHSLPTLIALLGLVVVLYIFSGMLEALRSGLFARIGHQFDLSLRDAVFALNVRSTLPGSAVSGQSPFRDLEQIRGFLAGGGPAAIFDLPWMPIYIVLMFLMHPWLGTLGLVGAIALIAITWINDKTTRPKQQQAQLLNVEASGLADSVRMSSETIMPMGMVEPMGGLWGRKNREAGEALIRVVDTTNFYGGLSRFLRTCLQSFSLALGAWLILMGEATGGVMIASSILLGKALSPVETAIAQWRGFVGAREAYGRLETALQSSQQVPQVKLPMPRKSLRVEGVYLGLPGQTQPLLNNINFELEAGDALGIIGPSGSGKSSLVRALVGVWPTVRGSIRFDGSTFDQWSDADRGGFIGYMPQSVDLFAGTVGENIARFHPGAPDAAVLMAAQHAGVEQMVRGLEKGFETDVGPRGSRFSMGQRQRIALARALYGDPFMVVLDEPNSALDNDGEMALVAAIAAIRARGGIAIIVAHRPNVLQTVNKVLLLGDGQQKGFGPRDEIFKRVLNPVGRTPPPTAGVAS